MLKRTIGLLLLLLAGIGAFAQNFTVQGKVADSATTQPLVGVNIIVSKFRDTTQKFYAISDINGNYKIELPQGGYRLETRYIGYAKSVTTIRVGESGFIPTIYMAESALSVTGAEVVHQLPPVQIKGDTTEFNSEAFKVNPDATAEDLVKKMPGITVEGGKVQAEGEDVKKVLVDGKEFFGDDPTLTLRTIPADMIDKVQVYNQMSDQSAFTGVDDGNGAKAINIITKKEKRNGTFGRIYGGYGTNDRYSAGATLNIMKPNARLSVLGLSNNINQQNFAIEDLFGLSGGSSGGRGGGGFRMPSEVTDFLVGQQNGISTTHSFGMNYSGELGKKVKLTGSYFFNTSDNKNSQSLTRTTFLGGDSNQLYNETSQSNSQNFNHRVNLRFDYTIDSSNSILITPKLSLQTNNSKNSLDGLSQLQTEQRINSLINNNGADISGYNFDNDILFKHKFAKRGRTLSVNFGTSLNKQDRNNYLLSVNQFYTSTTISDSLDQNGNTISDGTTLSARVAYTEAIGQKGLLQISYDGQQKLNKSDKYTYNQEQGTYTAIDTTLSNAFTNTYTTHSGGLDYTYNIAKGSNVSAGAELQQATLVVDQRFPNNNDLTRVFTNVLPNVSIRLAFSEKSNLHIRYRTRTNAPSATQLQNVVNNTNPILLSTGNPNLQQEYNHFLFSRYRIANPQKGRSMFVIAFLSTTQNYISTSTTIARADTTVNGIELNRGSQLSVPVNVSGYWNARTFLMYNLPLKFLKSNLGTRTGVTYSRTPALINNRVNYAHNTNFSEGITIGSNISKNVDFTLSYSANYTIVNNTILPELNNNYFYHVAGAKLNWIFWKSIVFRTEANQTLYSGLSGGFNQNFMLWNASLGKKFLKNNSGELSLSVFDILSQNNSINRNVTQTYVEDTRTQVLNRYFMLTFTYTFKKFKSGATTENPEENEDIRRRYQHWQERR